MARGQLIGFFMDRLRPGWRERQARRRSVWRLPKLLVMFALMGGTGFVLFRFFWLVHTLAYPDHAGRLDALLAEHDDTSAIVARGLMIFPPFLPAIGIGLVLTNLLFWCIPWARRAFEAEALIPREEYAPSDFAEVEVGEENEMEGHAATLDINDEAMQTPVIDPEMQFRGATLALLRITLKYLVPIGGGLALIGALLPFDLP